MPLLFLGLLSIAPAQPSELAPAEGALPLPAPDRPGAEETPPARLQSDGLPHFAIGVSPSYALRLHADGRSHGGGGHVWVDLPLFWGFGLEAQTFTLGWGPTEQAQRPLGLVAASPLLIYSFDDVADIGAIVGIGPVGAAGFELRDDGTVPYAVFGGALFQFGVRYAFGPSTRLDATIRAPVFVYGPEGIVLRAPFGDDRSGIGFFPAQVTLGIGLTFEPMAFVDAIRVDHDPFGGLVPHWLLDFL